MLRRGLIFLYGVLSYLLFLGTFLYVIGFVTNQLVPRSIDAAPSGDFLGNLLTDLALLLLFALQHSVMARKPFKRWLTRWLPEAAERSTFVLASNLALIVLVVNWRPLGGDIWRVHSEGGVVLLNVLGAFGWLLALASTFMIDHFDLFGLRQVWLCLRGTEYRPLRFGTPGPYRYVRHPLYLGFLFAFWSTPAMTVTHLVFAVVTTVYILFAIQLEERDLVAHLGAAYRSYQQRVPMIVPFLRTPPKPMPSVE